jgi:hypothetical protein
MPPKGKTGVNTSGIEVSPERRRKVARRRAAQERRWAAKNGPVIVTRKDPEG